MRYTVLVMLSLDDLELTRTVALDLRLYPGVPVCDSSRKIDGRVQPSMITTRNVEE